MRIKKKGEWLVSNSIIIHVFLTIKLWHLKLHIYTEGKGNSLTTKGWIKLEIHDNRCFDIFALSRKC